MLVGLVKYLRKLILTPYISDVYFAQQELYCLIESRVLVFMSE
jgi:hypothetical protein